VAEHVQECGEQGDVGWEGHRFAGWPGRELALVLGVTFMSISATGMSFILGERNAADRTSELLKRGAALSLRVEEGQPP
jgi:hypothetical protein